MEQKDFRAAGGDATPGTENQIQLGWAPQKMGPEKQAPPKREVFFLFALSRTPFF